MNPHSRHFTRRFTVLTAGLGVAAILTACGGGGAGSAKLATPSAVHTAIYITDDFSAQYDAVWLTMTRITAVNAAGAETELAAYNPGRLVNLPTLRQTGALIATTALPSDATSVRVYVDSTAKLQQLDGSTLNVTAPAYLDFSLGGWNAASGVLALDFNLTNFTLQGNTLVPATRIASVTDYAQWNQRYAEINGSVTAVSAGSLTVNSPAFGSVQIALDANTTYVAKSASSWTPAVGDLVGVDAAVAGQGSSQISYTAQSVKRESGLPATGGFWKVKGLVIGVNGSQLTLNATESEHGAATGSVTIDIAGASYTRGNAASLVAGAVVEAYVDASGNTWVASVIQIEGAATARQSAEVGHGGSGDSGAYAELKGRVISFSGSNVVVQAVNTEGSLALPLGSQVNLDLSQVSFKKGAASCLAAGAPIDIKGYLDATGTLRPVQAELEVGCSAAVPVSGVSGDDSSFTQPLTGAVFVDGKGAITALRVGEFDLSVYRMDHTGTAPANITVAYDSSTVFKHVLPTQLAAGLFVEVKGTLQGSRLQASKIAAD